ncbi:putative powdery mildew-specific protein, partial [Golovinomyces cichoracearum]
MSVQLPIELQKYKKYIDLSKWDDDEIDLNIEEANAKTLQTYIAQRLAWYAEIDYTAGRLWELYREDFKKWTLGMMDKSKVDILYLLRDSLAKNGVYVPRDNRRLAIRLLEVVNEEEEHEWTQEEIEIQTKRGGGFSSSYVPSHPEPYSYTKINQAQNMKKETDIPGRQEYQPIYSDQILRTPQYQPSKHNPRQTSTHGSSIPMTSSR